MNDPLPYQAPIDDLLFLLTEMGALDRVSALPDFADASDETVVAVLEEAARFISGAIAPLNRMGDTAPATWRDGNVATSPGFVEAYRQYRDGGWQGLQHPAEFGGQGLPKLVAAACMEMLNAASLAFALCPLLTDGAIEALLVAGTPMQRARYLPRLVSGEWTGTMNLTEPQAGSDLSQVATRAVPQADGRYRLFGTKIFITYGDHDLADNILHLVLARISGAPAGVKGLSLFLVPKYLVDEPAEAEGVPRPACSVGRRNDVRCVSIEHKLGIHGSPTALLQFGDAGGAWGELVGEPHHGLQMMFIMMNAARFGVGVQGVAIADRACQAARQYAQARIQGRPLVSASASAPSAPSPAQSTQATADKVSTGRRPIADHPDVRRMLTRMRALTEGARAVAFQAAAASDLAQHAVEPSVRAANAALLEYLVPIVKGWSTEMAVDVTGMAIQVHGGMGYVEETGVAQLWRDARILPIYEGTTAIQANDLVGRKTVRDDGAVAQSLLESMDATVAEIGDWLSRGGGDAAVERDAHPANPFSNGRIAVSMSSIATQLQMARDAYSDVVDFVVGNADADPVAVYAGAVAYLRLAGIALSGWQLAQSALRLCQRATAAQPANLSFALRKIDTARFFAEQVLPEVLALRVAVVTARGNEGYLSSPGT